MSRSRKTDPLTEMLSSLKPLEPRPGLEQEIYTKIMQEPPPKEEPVRANWGWLRSTAAVASFIGALVLIGTVYFSAQQDSFQRGSAPKTANMSAPEAAQNQKAPNEVASDSNKTTTEKQAGAATESASVMVAQDSPALTKGVRLTLREPGSVNDQAVAMKVGEKVTPDDLGRILKELYAAGAEWVQVNRVMVTPQDEISWNGQSLSVKGQILSPPYVIEVSGDPEPIRQAVEREGSQIDTLKRAARIEASIETVK